MESEEVVRELSAVLDRRSAELEAIPGVTGWGVGITGSQDAERVAIKVYVVSPAVAEAVERQLGELFKEHPFEVIYMPTPYAQ